MPIAGPCFYAIQPEHSHPAYSFLLDEESYSMIDRTEGVNFCESSCPINNDETYCLIDRRFGVMGDQPILWVSRIASTSFRIWLTERETRAG